MNIQDVSKPQKSTAIVTGGVHSALSLAEKCGIPLAISNQLEIKKEDKLYDIQMLILQKEAELLEQNNMIEILRLKEKTADFCEESSIMSKISAVSKVSELLKQTLAKKDKISIILQRSSQSNWISLGKEGQEEFNSMVMKIPTILANLCDSFKKIIWAFQFMESPLEMTSILSQIENLITFQNQYHDSVQQCLDLISTNDEEV
ncbi:putative HAUS augmin-like complex subunit 2 [Monocercomonoides exilis]|uniref:putative HAUS augmin-like complex subunit 2 n=1 Tax=Monocercomonoides exilis TaxID=2049356 RepID=UPI003559628B|nr:putative HAUS augmin-like complex subunit 2 [Monocercomonoides exilis]